MKHLHGTEACRGHRGKAASRVCAQTLSLLLSVCLSVCLSPIQSVFSLSVFSSVCLSVCLPVPLSLFFPFYPLVSLPFMQSCNRLKCSLIIIAAAFGVGGGKGTSYSQSSQSRLYNIIMFIYLSDLFTQDLHRICPTLSCAQ